MQNPFMQAGLILAVLLGLYGFYCHWEAGRVELAAAFRHRREGNPAGDDTPQYRTRCRWALLGCALLIGSTLLLGL